MFNNRENCRKSATWTASLLVAGSFAFSPVLFPALAAQIGGVRNAQKNWVSNFTPASIDSKLAERFKRQADLKTTASAIKTRFPFTPTGGDLGASHTVTIAARTDSLLSSQAISTRNLIRITEPGLLMPVNLNKSDFRLTAARGWKDFKLPEGSKPAFKTPVANISAAAGAFRLDSNDTAIKKSRFKTDVKLDASRNASPSPRGNAAAGEYKVGVESSFSLSKRVDLTAGVTYNTERDRVAPRADDRKDSEAVYVGTKIRF